MTEHNLLPCQDMYDKCRKEALAALNGAGAVNEFWAKYGFEMGWQAATRHHEAQVSEQVREALECAERLADDKGSDLQYSIIAKGVLALSNSPKQVSEQVGETTKRESGAVREMTIQQFVGELMKGSHGTLNPSKYLRWAIEHVATLGAIKIVNTEIEDQPTPEATRHAEQSRIVSIDEAAICLCARCGTAHFKGEGEHSRTQSEGDEVERGVVEHLVKRQLPQLILTIEEMRANFDPSDINEISDALLGEISATLDECSKQLNAFRSAKSHVDEDALMTVFISAINRFLGCSLGGMASADGYREAFKIIRPYLRSPNPQPVDESKE